MRLHTRAAFLAGITLLVLSVAAAADAQVVTFSGISDAVAGRFFNAATSAPAPAAANTLRIGFNSGFDSALLKYRDFQASTATYRYTTAMDSISFTVKAPSGFYIAKITYKQRGTGSVVRTGKAAGASNWIVAGRASNIGTFATNPTISRTVDLTSRRLTSVPVSITTSLFAYAAPGGGSATVALTGAEVVIELLPL